MAKTREEHMEEVIAEEDKRIEKEGKKDAKKKPSK